jgi:hypothetical protein
MSPPSAFYLLHAVFLLGVFFDPEYNGDIVLRNVGGLSTDSTELHARRQNSSKPFLENLKSYAIHIWPVNVFLY